MATEDSGAADYLARCAYRAYRDWMPKSRRQRLPAFALLTPEEKKAWREVALTIWNEVWTNARPTMSPAPVPRARSGKTSAFALLE
ncbi:MAG: hypothetical protein ACREJM_06055, partial [Candidatus Saccharimonadales bacterium]